MFAYGLIATIAIVVGITGIVWSRKHKARKRRLRGIKSYTPASARTTMR